MPSAKYSFKLEGERQWNINRKSRVLTKHVPANGAPGNASGMVHMLMVQSQAEFFWGGHRMGRSVYPFGVRSLFRTRVLVLVAFYGLRVHRETRTRGGRCHVHQTAWTHPQHPCVQNCRRGGEDRWSFASSGCGKHWETHFKPPKRLHSAYHHKNP